MLIMTLDISCASLMRYSLTCNWILRKYVKPTFHKNIYSTQPITKTVYLSKKQIKYPIYPSLKSTHPLTVRSKIRFTLASRRRNSLWVEEISFGQRTKQTPRDKAFSMFWPFYRSFRIKYKASNWNLIHPYFT